MVQKPVVHVVFGRSAAASLKLALEQIGCQDQVIGQYDDLSLGPIDGRAEERQKWLEHELAYDDYREVPELDILFWAEAISPEIYPVVWVSRRCAREYAGFLEFLWRLGHTDFSIVDATNLLVQGPYRQHPAITIAVLSPGKIIETQLLNAQEHLAASEIDAYRSMWKHLREENAALRVVTRRGLVSAPITYFDNLISSHITQDWQKCARVLGMTLADHIDGPFYQTGDLLLWARLRVLADTHAFEHRGDLSLMHHSEIRRK
jgi:hypothetical protein